MLSIVEIYGSIRTSGGKIDRQGKNYILINVAVSCFFIFSVMLVAEKNQDPSWFDVTVETGNCLMQFLLFLLVAFLPLQVQIKTTLLLGFVITQLGLLVDLLDDLFHLNIAFWQFLSDTLYFIGSLLVLVGVAHWIILTYKQATIDPLTGVFNRRFFSKSLENQISRMQRNESPCSLLFFDLDNFKQINDKFGHEKGDEVLRLVSKILSKSVRVSDIVCRSGGEEFEVLLLDAAPDQATAFATRVMKSMREQTPEPLNPITASVGVTLLKKDDSIAEVRHRADAAMYKAKKGGKDRVVIGE